MTYYEILGVSKDAHTRTIKAAYRRLAQQHHPDKGGDTATFTAIQKAYETLGDPDARAHYDRYGVERPNDSTLTKAKQMVATLFQMAMSSTVNEHTDVLQRMSDHLAGERSKALTHLRGLNRDRDKNLVVLHRLTAKGDEHLLLDLLTNRRQEVWSAYRATQENIRTMGIAKGLLDGYDYAADKYEAYQPYQPQHFFINR